MTAIPKIFNEMEARRARRRPLADDTRGFARNWHNRVKQPLSVPNHDSAI